MNKTFEFRKIRDFGSVMNHSFDFIKLEYKRLGKALLIYVLPFFVLTGILLIFIQTSLVDTVNNGVQPGSSIYQNYPWKNVFSSYIIQLLNHTVLTTVVLSFISLYIKKNAEFKVDDLRPYLIRTGIKLLLAYVVIFIIVVLGSIFLLIPGIYLGIVFSLVAPVIVFEETGLGTAMNRSFDVIKENWWKTFGILIIGWLIVYVFSLILSIPLLITTFTKTFHAVTNQTQPQIFSSGYLIFSTIISIIQTFAYSLILIFISIQYFSLVEVKERPTLQAKIDKLTEENA